MTNHLAELATDVAAVAQFRGRLEFETDPSDVHAALESEEVPFVLVDTRSEAAWTQGRIPGAVHLPTSRIADEATALISRRRLVVTYCWGPGCNGATRAALAFAELGYRVKEMIGGFEYWAREGFVVETDAGRTRAEVDPLTAPLNGTRCEC